jgi:osmoprotectant transport system ATP-binding protein
VSTAQRVVFEHVTKRYPGTSRNTPGAVEDLSLEVPAGKTCVLVGPSGCGKTTSLKMINRLIEPTSGRILIGDTDVLQQDLIELRRGIGYVIQQVGLFPHQTVAENVATVPRLLGWAEGRRRERAAELLELVGLDPVRYANRYPSALSGGERQRVGVARALAADPPVLLMDEPFGAVDPIVRERLQNELLNLQEQLAKTILFVTHDIDEAIKMGDLVAVLQVGGHLAQFGTPDEILSNPASDFVARFVGADRGLKRLALQRVGELDLTQAVIAHPGDDAAGPRSRALGDDVPYILMLDERERPIGWVAAATCPAFGPLDPTLATAMSPLFDRHTTLKDALSMLLASDVQAGIAIDGKGAYQGLVTADSITERMRAARPAPSAAAAPAPRAAAPPGPAPDPAA